MLHEQTGRTGGYSNSSNVPTEGGFCSASQLVSVSSLHPSDSLQLLEKVEVNSLSKNIDKPTMTSSKREEHSKASTNKKTKIASAVFQAKKITYFFEK